MWARSLRLAKHQRGSGSPASMASDSWIAASMRQSDAEIDTIAARPSGKRGAASRRSSVSSRRLCGAHIFAIAGGQDRSVDAATATVAKRPSGVAPAERSYVAIGLVRSDAGESVNAIARPAAARACLRTRAEVFLLCAMPGWCLGAAAAAMSGCGVPAETGTELLDAGRSLLARGTGRLGLSLPSTCEAPT